MKVNPLGDYHAPNHFGQTLRLLISCTRVGVTIPSMRWLTRKCSEARVKSWASFELNDPHFKEHREVKTLLRNHVHSLSTSRLPYTKDIFAECAWKEEIIFVGKNYKGSVMFNKLQHTCNPNNDQNNYFLMDNFIAHRWHFKPRRSDSLYTLKLQR